MKSFLRFAPLHAVVTLLLIFTIGLFSCGKKADPSIIKVSETALSGTTPGTGTSTNTGDGGIPVGLINTCTIKVGSDAAITFAPPTDTLKVGVGDLLVLASVESGSENSSRYFALLSGATKAGLFDITGCRLVLNGQDYLAGTGQGKVNYTKFEASNFVNGSAVSAALQGTFDLTVANIKTGVKSRIVGSFNLAK